MAPIMKRWTVFLGVVAASGLKVSAAADPRPTTEEWKKEQDAAAAAKAAKAADAKKGAAVGKAVELLESLKAKVEAEGESEAQTYNKFACFCKDTSKEKAEAIQKGEDQKASLIADINELTTLRGTLDDTIAATAAEIDSTDKAMKEATSSRKATLKLYNTNAADLQAALDALSGAIKTLKASKNPPKEEPEPSFLQQKAAFASVARTVSRALSLASALGLADGAQMGPKDRNMMALLQQSEPENGNEVPMEDYDFHSNGIIATLEKLLGSFREEKVEVDKEEAESVAQYEQYMQQSEDHLKALNKRLAETKQKKEETTAEIEANSQRLTTTEATLKDDKEYASELAKMCSDKAKTWDQRSTTRAAELSTLTQAITIIKGVVKDKTTSNTIRFGQVTSLRAAESVARSPSAMEAIEEEAEAEEAAPSFLETRSNRVFAQIRRLRGSGPDDGTEFVRQMLETQGKELKSTVLASLATQLAKDPFAKVKTLIQELITRLLQEANNEANQKGWCDRSIADAQQKRTYAADKILDLNSQMTKLESTRDALKEELAVLGEEIAAIQNNQRIAKEERDAESAQNAATVKEAEEGLEALKMCIDLLDKFYKTIAKGSVDLSLAQGPADDAPDAGFDNGEAYLGAQSENGGILGMLDVMKSDFTRTIQETTAAEAAAVADFEEFMTESGKSLAVKTEAESAKKTQLDAADTEYAADQESMASQTMILKTAIKELIELQPVCIDTGMTYEERVARREGEIKALNKAVCVLERYQEYGPEGAADGC